MVFPPVILPGAGNNRSLLMNLYDRPDGYSGFSGQIPHFLPRPLRVGNLLPGALSDIPANINHVDGICHVDLAFMHIIQHLLRPFGPDLLVAGMTKKTNADNDVTSEGEAFLRLDELVLETGTAAKGDDGIFTYHTIAIYMTGSKLIFFSSVS